MINKVLSNSVLTKRVIQSKIKLYKKIKLFVFLSTIKKSS